VKLGIEVIVDCNGHAVHFVLAIAVYLGTFREVDRVWRERSHSYAHLLTMSYYSGNLAPITAGALWGAKR